MLFSMFLLYLFSNILCKTLNVEEVAAVYLTGGMVSNLADHMWKLATKISSGSVGAVSTMALILHQIY